MIWLNIKELEKQLINGRMSDKVAFNYLLTHLIFITIAGSISSDDDPWVAMVYLIVSLITVIWGVKKTFEINQQGDNRDYFKRVISISFVANIRVAVLVFSVTFIIVLVKAFTEIAGSSIVLSSFQEEIFHLVSSLAILGIDFYILLNSFKRINAADSSRSQAEVT
jgi:hypothetical protein